MGSKSRPRDATRQVLAKIRGLNKALRRYTTLADTWGCAKVKPAPRASLAGDEARALMVRQKERMLGDFFTLHEVHCLRVHYQSNIDLSTSFFEDDEWEEVPYAYAWGAMFELREQEYLAAVGTVTGLLVSGALPLYELPGFRNAVTRPVDMIWWDGTVVLGVSDAIYTNRVLLNGGKL